MLVLSSLVLWCSIQVTILGLIAVAAALLTEAAALKLRRRPFEVFLTDYSAVVAAVLLALALPPLIPLLP